MTTNEGELRKELDKVLDEFEKQLRIDISNHISGDKSRNCAITHIDCRKILTSLLNTELDKARLDEIQRVKKIIKKITIEDGKGLHIVGLELLNFELGYLEDNIATLKENI